MGERVRFGAARPAVRREIVKALRCDYETRQDILSDQAACEIESLERKISRIGGVLTEVLAWAHAQDEELLPGWVEKLTAAVEDEC